mgnify:CR=1 FL=1
MPGHPGTIRQCRHRIPNLSSTAACQLRYPAVGGDPTLGDTADCVDPTMSESGCGIGFVSVRLSKHEGSEGAMSPLAVSRRLRRSFNTKTKGTKVRIHSLHHALKPCDLRVFVFKSFGLTAELLI